MIPRYSHPTVTDLWSDEWTYGAWLTIERQALAAQIALDVVPWDAKPLARWLDKCHVDDETAGQINRIERTETHHDVAAFLKYLRDVRGEDDAKWLHYGLTSSDLVDTAQAMRFRVLHGLFQQKAKALLHRLAERADDSTPMLGITHGQAGEPTSMRARVFGWIAEIEFPLQAVNRQNRAMQLMKLSGPMGTFAYNPPKVERAVADALGLIPMGPGATQILPRSCLSMWASSCAALVAACAKVAHDLRLMSLSGEVHWPRDGAHVGSSAMPHKNNPIEAEQIAGFARLARGYAASLEQGMLWMERDISNSSVERVAVPDLWHIVLKATEQMAWVLEHMELRPFMIEQNLINRANEAWSHRVRLAEIADGATFEDATDIALDNQVESYDLMGDARWFTRNYPETQVAGE